MELSDFAETILLGNRWEDKIVAVSGLEDGFPRRLNALPRFPARPSPLSRIGRSEFPKIEKLRTASARGQLLHFFANHELLAMELMALSLLKFPEAETEFRLGLAHTIREEQRHLKMYVGRMRELGIEFGDLPVSDYFWNALKISESPLEFVVQMSLTLEQANLDFSFYYQRAVADVGDAVTAKLLETVYREEIGHVKHGLLWFNRWRERSFTEDDWSAYLRLLPRPMTPRRAKGPLYCAEARRQAGFSERYIREMEVYRGSKGRPPSFWFYNPLCEAEIVRGKPGLSPTKTVHRLGLDLETIPLFLALETDVVLVHELPRAEWLKSLQDAGVRLPEFRIYQSSRNNFPEANIAGAEPWGWSPEVFEIFKPSVEKLRRVESANGVWAQSLLRHDRFSDTNLGDLFSKTWSLEFYQTWRTNHPEDDRIFGSASNIGSRFTDWGEAERFLREQLSDNRPLLAKAPWGTSGTLNKKILKISELDSPLGKWMQKVIESQGSLILEPWLNKEVDLSLQLEVQETSHRILGVRRFLNGNRQEYRGTLLEPKLNSLTDEQLTFLLSDRDSPSPMDRWKEMANTLASALREKGYRGPMGIDAMMAREGGSGDLFLRPIVEVNPRWTMGRVALAIEDYVLPGISAAWLFLPVDFSGARIAERLLTRYPLRKQTKGGRTWISEGVLFTNDPQTSREVLTVLAVGTKAVADLVGEVTHFR
jgi:uncharacterized ferritin-like protein (DUF455 family)